MLPVRPAGVDTHPSRLDVSARLLPSMHRGQPGRAALSEVSTAVSEWSGDYVNRPSRADVELVRDQERERRRRRRELRDVETMDYAKFVRRVVRRYGERLSEADYPDLADAIVILEELREAVAVGCRAQAERTSWASVATGLGVTRQGAWQRFGRRVDPPT